jgi:hypothetical protein
MLGVVMSVSKENIPPINSSGNSLYVYFTSDGIIAKSGFSATYYTDSVGKNKCLLITSRYTVNLFIFAISTNDRKTITYITQKAKDLEHIDKIQRFKLFVLY